MSTIKVDTYLTRGGASEIAIDKLKGVTAAGSMLVVGEGGTTTTNLQQGLAKAWANFHGVGGTALDDSFNITSIADNGTGDTTITVANDLASVHWSYAACVEENDGAGTGRGVALETGGKAAGTARLIHKDGDASTLRDLPDVGFVWFGDLA